MKEKLVSILETFCPDDVYLQGTMNAEEVYPPKFISFFVTTSDFDAFYDDDANYIDWSISVMFYSNNPQEVLTIPPQIIRALRAEGFIPEGAGNDIMCDVKTHTGWAMDFYYKEKYTN